MNSQKFRYSFLIFYFIVQSKSQDSFLLISFFHLIYIYYRVIMQVLKLFFHLSSARYYSKKKLFAFYFTPSTIFILIFIS